MGAMALLLIYVSVALGFSFLCSVAEAVLLSVTGGHIAVLEKQGHPAGKVLRRLKSDINRPLAAILTLNTIAHTVGAAGAGAQAAVVFGNAYLGVASAVLTLLILVFSEIIPKTLGAHYWKQLAPLTAYSLKALVWLLYPFVKLSEWLTQSLTHGPSLRGFNRAELAAMAELSSREGLLPQRESRILKNLLSLHEARVQDAMTPRTVVFSVAEDMTVGEFFAKHETEPFSRIPIHGSGTDEVTGFVLRADLLLAQARGDTDAPVSALRRELPVVPGSIPLAQAFDQLLEQRSHMVLVVGEYGGADGILTLEDVLETLLGLEIVDEVDRATDMQQVARRLWRRRAKKMGLEVEETAPEGAPPAVDGLARDPGRGN
jgi:CBS domain containing-hemolysin-like protein